jgi:hypothetical protein
MPLVDAEDKDGNFIKIDPEYLKPQKKEGSDPNKKTLDINLTLQGQNNSDIGKYEEMEQLKSERDSLKKELDAVKNPPSNTGGTPLNSAQMGISQQPKSYPNEKAMIDDLMERKRNGDTQASAAIERLNEKVFLGLKNNRNQQFSTPEQPKGETKQFHGFQLGDGTIAEYLRASRPRKAIEAEKQLRGN